MDTKETAAPAEAPERGRPSEVFAAFLKLGCTSFGGPIAHLGYFRSEFVEARRWLDEETFVDLVALCQFLPGPASSQVGLALGWRRAGWRGALAAWLGFTMPSAAIMMAFAYGVGVAGDLAHQGWVQGLKVAAVAIVAQAVLGMARNLCPDRARAVLACVVAIVLTLFTAAWVQLAGIAGGAIAGHFFGHWFKLAPSSQNLTAAQPSRNLGIACLSLFTGLLVFLPCLGKVRPTAPILVFDEFYRAGALVFGGGHVVLPLLQKATVGRGWIDQNIFMTGYGAAQALPGPLFAFSSYLGVIMAPGGIYGGLLALTAIYLPAVLVLFGALPCWDRLRSGVWARSVLAGANAAVVGLLAAALYSHIWTTTVNSQSRFALAVASFAGLQLGRLPPWLVVGTCAGIGALAFG